MRPQGKSVLISTWQFPPANSGSAIILYELLQHLPQDAFIAVHGPRVPGTADGPALDIPGSAVSVLGSYLWTVRFMNRLPRLYTALIKRHIVRLARQHHVKRIYAHYPSDCFAIAAWQAAEQLDLPLTVYMDILWEEGALDPALARNYEHRVLERADRRFAITESAAAHLEQKHGLKFELVPHVIDSSNLPTGLVPVPGHPRPVVHFSGSIYDDMNLDSMVRLGEAAARARTRPLIDVCSNHLPVELHAFEIGGRHLTRSEVMAAQSQSTVLFLPQAFNSSRGVMIRHNLPTKTMDYLRSGRPILVHSPADSHLSNLARREGFALVVDRPDADELAAALDRLIADTKLQEDLVSRALDFVRSRDSKLWSVRLWEALNA
jgi:glycosyltransferase involved in cell wall biosynthesis